MARTGNLGLWAASLAAVFLAAASAAGAAGTTGATGATAQEAGCKGQVVVDAGHGGRTPGR